MGGLPRTIFREYDVRGRVDTELTPEVAELVARSYGEWLSETAPGEAEKGVLVGRDNRRSSRALREAVIRGLGRAGLRVIDIGVVPTPVFYFSRTRYGVDGGVMITGSHNPPEYNGMKLARGFGTIYGEDIRELGRRAEALAWGEAAGGEGATGTPSGGGVPVTYRRPVRAYIRTIADRVRLGPRRLKVVVDAGNGTAGRIAVALYEALGCEVIPLYCEPDGRFPNHWPDPVKPENLADLVRTVRETGADCGVAFDGDADRLGVVDEQGNILWGDDLMILFWREILPRHPGTPVIVEVKCSQAVFDEARRLGGDPFFYRTGHSLIKAKMREIGALFAGEMSGHMFFADEYFGFDDAIYAGARLLRILSGSDRPLSDLLADRPRYHSTPETRITCPDEAKFEVVERVRNRYVARGAEVVDVDGARVIFPDGWLLVRASNTQPALVVRCEGRTPEALAALKAEAVAALKEAGAETGLELPEW
ncbi:MAG TPA: phosphomannomutase [Clostridiales bacterium]|nr:phosphomannomutase [Clostridiales bacterium]